MALKHIEEDLQHCIATPDPPGHCHRLADEESEERRKRVPERRFSDLIQRHPLRLSFRHDGDRGHSTGIQVELTGKRRDTGGRIIL
jgi:hypothetical protein